MTDPVPRQLEAILNLQEYEATALANLLELGRTSAPDLAQATGIPKARIYSVLEALADMGYIKIIPGRPKQYQPKSPEQILERASENARQRYESRRSELESSKDEFLERFGPLYEQASKSTTPTEEFFWVVDVGDPSETETRALYREADERIQVLTKSFEYLDDIEPALAEALDRQVPLEVLFLHPEHLSTENQRTQAEILEYLWKEYPGVDTRFSNEPLPWRGTLTDPSMEYDTGKAIFLVEERDIPLSMRQAAVTDNGSFVAGLSRYFELIWKHDSLDDYPGEV